MATIAPTDVLVAVADRNVMAALAMGDELYRAGVAASRAEEAYEKACNTPGFDDGIRRRRRDARNYAANVCAHLSARFEALMADADDDLYKRVEATVWRDRVAEYAHAREIREREKLSR